MAAVHDVGKASPAFASKVPVLAGRMSRHGLVTQSAVARDPQRGKATHALVGHVVVREWLAREFGFERLFLLRVERAGQIRDARGQQRNR